MPEVRILRKYVDDPKQREIGTYEAHGGYTALKKALLEIQHYILDQAYLHQIQSFESPTVVQPYLRDYFPGFGSLQTEPDKWSVVWLDK